MSKINEAILNVYKEVGYVYKEGRIEFGRTKYSFAGEADFIKALRPVMITHGLTWRQKKVTHVEVNQVIVQKPIIDLTIFDKTIIIEKEVLRYEALVDIIYEIRHVEGECLDIPSTGFGIDTGDKALAKALTMALKYALRQLFLIETGDDPDNTASEVYELIDNMTAWLDKDVSIDEFKRLEQGAQEKINTLKNVSYKDYATLNKQLKMKKQELSAEKQKVGEVKPEKKDGAFDKLLTKLESKELLMRFDFLAEDKILKWVRENCNKEQRHVLYSTAIHSAVDYVENNPDDDDMSVFIMQKAFYMAVFKDDVDIIHRALAIILHRVDLELHRTTEKLIDDLKRDLPVERS